MATLALAAAPALGAVQERDEGRTTSENPLAEILRAPGTEHALPTPDQAMDAYAALEAALEAWQPPGRVDTPAAAVRVVLHPRAGGAMAGEAIALSETAGPDGPLAQAAAEAMELARRAIAPRAGALSPTLLAAEHLTLELELAGPLTPLSRAELLDPDASLRPGLDGLAARVDDRWRLVFPAQMTASTTTIATRLGGMASGLLGDPTLGLELPADLADRHGVRFYRFETVRIAGVGPEGSPIFLTRGGRLIERSEITTASLARFAEELIDHLHAVRITDPPHLGLMGPVHSARGVAEPPVGTPTQQALGALALVRAARSPSLDEALRSRAATLAESLMTDLARVEPGEAPPADDPVAAGVSWVVLDELERLRPDGGPREPGALRSLRDACESRLAAHAAAEPPGPGAGVAEAVLTWALCERARREGADADPARAHLRALFRHTPPGALAGLTPWIGWAELALAPADEPLPARAALRDLRDAVWTHQLALEDTGHAERDLLGGIVFTDGGTALPTWNSARPVAMLATMLADPRCTTPGEANHQILRLIDAMRFLRQLSVGPDCAAMCTRPDLARGGVRAALWDPRQPPEATALTLLAVCEFLDALEALQNRPSP